MSEQFPPPAPDTPPPPDSDPLEVPESIAERIQLITAAAAAVAPIFAKMTDAWEKNATATAHLEAARIQMQAKTQEEQVKTGRLNSWLGSGILVFLLGAVLIIAGRAAWVGEWDVAEKLALPIVAFLSGVVLGKAH